MPADQNEQRTIETRSGAGARGALWLIGVSLAVIATCMVLRSDGTSTPAFAQPMQQAGARGIFAFTGELTKDSYGLFMVDVDEMTVWCYEYNSSSRQLCLVAARSWMYDRYLKNFNSCPPSPEEVENMVQMEREAKLRSMGK